MMACVCDGVRLHLAEASGQHPVRVALHRGLVEGCVGGDNRGGSYRVGGGKYEVTITGLFEVNIWGNAQTLASRRHSAAVLYCVVLRENIGGFEGEHWVWLRGPYPSHTPHTHTCHSAEGTAFCLYFGFGAVCVRVREGVCRCLCVSVCLCVYVCLRASMCVPT